MPADRWTDADFAAMSWHDNHVHGLRIVEGEHGAGEFVLDLDYLLEWLPDAGGCRFRIVPAELRFLGVTALRIELDYATQRAGLVPFSIHAIERRSEPRERYVAQVWQIAINWPAGRIEFEAAGFEQVATGSPVLTASQCLTAAERNRAG
jgi:hypothetical protein